MTQQRETQNSKLKTRNLKLRILLIEDNPGDADLIRELLPELYAIEHVTRLTDALGLIANKSYDTILADLGLPDSQGLETVRKLLGAAETVPIVVLTGLHDEDVSARAIAMGAQDFLVKGEYNTSLLIRSINYAIERKRSEQELVESEERFRFLYQQFNALLDANPDVLMLVSPEMKILWANNGAAVAAGLGKEELIGLTCYTVYHGQSSNCYDCPVKKAFWSGNIESCILTSADGTVRDIRSIPIKDAEGAVVSVIDVARDITEHRKLEEQLRQSQKMEAIGQLAGGVAHDFNNILSTIIGYCSLAQMKLPDDHAVRYDLEQILQSADRATNLTKSLLAFSRKQPLKMALIELNEVIGRFEKFLQRLLREDIELKIHFAGVDLPVIADCGQIEQILMNLVSNARDAISSKGRLVIETGLVVLDENFERTHGYGRQGEFSVIAVSDTGIGMDSKTREKIFEPFFTTKELGKGTGLGLATVYGIVKSHGGFINVYSEEGKGSTFRIYLPLVRDTEIKKNDEQLLIADMKGGTETVLLAEDDESLRRLNASILDHMGYTVHEAVDGDAAVEKFMKNRDGISLVILDGIMPGLNGKEVYLKIKEMCPDMPCLFVSGYAEDIFTKDGVPLEKVDFLTKPISPSVLLAKVREILDR